MMHSRLTNAMGRFVDQFEKANELAPSATSELHQKASEIAKETIQKTKKNTGLPVEPIPEFDGQCHARTWGRGDGRRCTQRAKDGCDNLCGRCFKLEQECNTPMTVHPTLKTRSGGPKKMGLFYGRYCDAQGNKLPLPYLTPDGSAVAVIYMGLPAERKIQEQAILSGKPFIGCAPYKYQIPQKLGGTKKQSGGATNSNSFKNKKSENKPKRPANAYVRYLNTNRAVIKQLLIAKGLQGLVSEIAKEAGMNWKKMTKEEKAPYQQEYEKAKAEMQLQNSAISSVNLETEENTVQISELVENTVQISESAENTVQKSEPAEIVIESSEPAELNKELEDDDDEEQEDDGRFPDGWANEISPPHEDLKFEVEDDEYEDENDEDEDDEDEDDDGRFPDECTVPISSSQVDVEIEEGEIVTTPISSHATQEIQDENKLFTLAEVQTAKVEQLKKMCGKAGIDLSGPKKKKEEIKLLLVEYLQKTTPKKDDNADSNADEDGEEIEEITLADGMSVWLDDDGQIWDPDTQELLGTYDSENNIVISNN